MGGIAESPQTKSGAMTSDTTDISLMRMFIAGPDVSLNGSPTVSPTTAAFVDIRALCRPCAPLSIYFFACPTRRPRWPS